MNLPLPRSAAQLRRWALAAGALILAVWLLFFDSHSLLRRYQWQQQLNHLTQENERLRRENARLQDRLDTPLSDEAVERIAREEYGMKRPDETVYRVQE